MTGFHQHVVACSYLGATTTDLESWREFAVDALGMQLASASTDSRLLLRIDERAWRFWIEKGENTVSFIGWEVATHQGLRALADSLKGAGVRVTWDDTLAKVRSVEALFRCTDPGGIQLEFFCSARIPFEPFLSPNGTRFVTSAKMPGDMGFGHVVIAYENIAAAREFYMNVLGFLNSDTCILGEPWTFAHVNPRHHSLAIGPNSKAATEMHHFMVEVENLDMVGYALDRLEARNVPLTTSIGRHTNDRMVSFYVMTPSGFEVEYGCEGLQIDDSAWLPATYDAPSYWGHKNLSVPDKALD